MVVSSGVGLTWTAFFGLTVHHSSKSSTLLASLGTIHSSDVESDHMSFAQTYPGLELMNWNIENMISLQLRDVSVAMADYLNLTKHQSMFLTNG